MSLLWNLRDFSTGTAINSPCVFSTIETSTLTESSTPCGPRSKLLALRSGPAPQPFLTPGPTQSWQLVVPLTKKEYKKHSQVENMPPPPPKRLTEHCTFSLPVGGVSRHYLSFIQGLSWHDSGPKIPLMWWVPETLRGLLSCCRVHTPHQGHQYTCY